MPLTRTTSGAVQGVQHGGVATFHNIPYAAPLLGSSRFAAPRPHSRWDGVRLATLAGPTAPQVSRPLGVADLSDALGTVWHRGVDYLTLTVRTPDVGGSGLPVLVFVHGGGFVAGSVQAPMLDGSAFARDGVVTVSVQYRLGIPGFLDLPGAPPNRGLLDVAAALDWVQDNIAAFGGDPARVTVAGHGAGADIVGALLSTPGLIRRAIMQSGTGRNTFSTEQAALVTRAAAAMIGVAPTVAALSTVPDGRLVVAAYALTGMDVNMPGRRDPHQGQNPFGLVLDRPPAETIAPGVELMAGTTTQEANLYLIPDGRYDTTTWDDVHEAAARAHPDPDRLATAYRESRPDADAASVRSAILGDALFGVGTWAMAAVTAFRYEFAWESSLLGAAHAVDLPFVFGTAHLPELHGPDRLLGARPYPSALPDRMHRAWVDFITSGNPGWPRHDRNERATMRIAEDWTVVHDPHAAERKAWSLAD